MKNIKCHKTTQKHENKYLWVISDEYGHTIIQIYSEQEPTDLINYLKG